MEPETVGLAFAVASSTIAALGLLHNWQRERSNKSRRFVKAIALAIVTTGVVGSVSIFVLDGGDSEGQIRPLSISEYQQRAGRACADARNAALRLRSLEPRQPVGSLTVKFERDALHRIAQLEPPAEFADAHRRAVALWKRRTALLDLAFSQPHQLPKNGLADTNRLANELTQIFVRLDVSECRI